MADVYSDIYQPSGTFPRDMHNAARKGGRVRLASGLITLAATIAAGDKGFVARLPSSCRLLPESTFYHSTGLTGLDDVDFGDANGEDALLNGDDWTSAGSVGAMAAVAPANYGKRLWELLGYTSDPRTDLALYLTFVGELTGSGTVFADLRYVHDN